MSDHQPHPTDVHVGQAIRLRRKVLGVTQSALAEAIGLTFQQVQKYERAANRVSCSVLVDIAAALDCQPADLLPRSEAPSIDVAESLEAVGQPGGLELIQAWMALPQAQRRALTRLAVELQAAAEDLGDEPGAAYVTGGDASCEARRHDA